MCRIFSGTTRPGKLPARPRLKRSATNSRTWNPGSVRRSAFLRDVRMLYWVVQETSKLLTNRRNGCSACLIRWRRCDAHGSGWQLSRPGSTRKDAEHAEKTGTRFRIAERGTAVGHCRIVQSGGATIPKPGRMAPPIRRMTIASLRTAFARLSRGADSHAHADFPGALGTDTSMMFMIRCRPQTGRWKRYSARRSPSFERSRHGVGDLDWMADIESSAWPCGCGGARGADR